MRTIIIIIRKEFLQVLRDKFIGRAIIAMPVLQMIVLVYAATLEIKDIDLLIIDRSKSSASTQLSNKFSASNFYHVTQMQYGDKEIENALNKGHADVVLIIPENFEKSLYRQEKNTVQLLIDAVNGSAGELSLAYCRATIAEFNSFILTEEFGISKSSFSRIDISSRYWYNPYLNYKIFMAPGILAVLITIIGWFMTGMNLVREKETGTIEQLNVTPILKYQFLAGKLIPFLLIGLLDLAFGLFLAWLLYRIPFEGSLITLFVFAAIYLIAVLGIGLFISTISNTQQQVLFVSFFFMMIFVIMSGLFTPVENMPQWGKIINWFNPLAYFSRVIRMVLLKGAGFADIQNEIIVMIIYGIVVNSLAIWRYRKTS